MRLAPRRLTPVYPALLLFVLASTAAAPTVILEKTGKVTGHVRDEKGAPIHNAQVFVVGTALQDLTDSAGIYVLAAVPEGRQEIRTAMVGYRPSQSTIQVRAGRTIVHNVVLAASPLQLGELTISGEPGRAEVARDVAKSRVEIRGQGWPAAPYANGVAVEPWRRQREPGNTEAYARIEENRFLAALANPLSTFSIDIDAASYSNVRRFLSQGQLPPADAVRLEEMVNYFPYTYPDRTGSHPFAVATEVGPCPWAPDHRLVRIGLQAKRIATRDLPPSNLTFLIDVSGSMQSEDKLPLVKQAFRALVQELRAEDRVAIVVYAGAAGLVLPPTSGAKNRHLFGAR
ncbi:MAG TPA: von Willebrand factor type A domain-containing protein, partial [Gemmatimonadales bacterium]|nr:von Willebrand factor type A domain-containing protein [Gemmatimonadales bacterium]